MNLKEILTYKDKIIEIAIKLGFCGLGIHNVGTPWMYEDSDGNLPLAFVATSGHVNNLAECRSRIGLLLGCKVDIVIEDPADVRSQYLRNYVDLTDKDLEEKLAKLFEVPLEEVEFTPLHGVERDIAEGHIRQKDSQAMIFQGPQAPQSSVVSTTPIPQQVEVIALSLRDAFNACLQQQLGSVSKEVREPLFDVFEQQIYPQAKKHFLDSPIDNTHKIVV